MIYSEPKDRISVIMIAASLPPLPAGGAEMQALRLGEALGRKGVTVRFITPGKGSLKGKDDIGGMTVFRLNSWMNRLFGRLSTLKKRKDQPTPTRIEYDDSTGTTRQISSRVGWPTIIYYNIFFIHSLLFLWPRRRSFDIIHAHTMEWSAIVAARLGKFLGKPVLIKDSTMNGFASLARFPSGSRLQQMIIMEANFVAMTKAIGANLLEAGIPGEKITRIPNGIRLTDGISRAPMKGQVIAATHSENPPHVLFVGNLYQQPAKGVDILLKAWHKVAALYPDAILDIVGDGDLAEYKKYTANLGIDTTVSFHGRQSGLPAWYAAATLFVLPSRREGMSNALMEAMLSGLPCVATDISGSQDLIRSGINGLIVPPADIDRLAEAIRYMLAHPADAAEMGRKARETIVQQLDIDVVAGSYVSLYRKLLKR
jgi:glycosyltransferase involved in cell wall biosynthesis